MKRTFCYYLSTVTAQFNIIFSFVFLRWVQNLRNVRSARLCVEIVALDAVRSGSSFLLIFTGVYDLLLQRRDSFITDRWHLSLLDLEYSAAGFCLIFFTSSCTRNRTYRAVKKVGATIIALGLSWQVAPVWVKGAWPKVCQTMSNWIRHVIYLCCAAVTRLKYSTTTGLFNTWCVLRSFILLTADIGGDLWLLVRDFWRLAVVTLKVPTLAGLCKGVSSRVH